MTAPSRQTYRLFGGFKMGANKMKGLLIGASLALPITCMAQTAPSPAEQHPAAPVQLAAPAQPAAPASAPMAVQPLVPVQTPANVVYLPAGYDIVVTPVDGITSKGHEVGSTFSIRTVYDVQYNGFIIIPHGTLGQARITWRTGKGVFGKSAKIDIGFDWLDLNGRRISLGGTYRQNGQGNTAATVGTTVGVGVATLGLGLIAGGFITGKSANIQPGTQMTAHTMEALPIALPAGASINPIQAQAPDGHPVQPATSNPVAAEPEKPKP